ncbi:MAG: polyprenol monophosphomannose synthase [Candidatus Omnitrophica bacterium]|nr:polyprenol monophosphomannose synthase [Candidatus Omnitrophota bacterium]
MDPEIKALVIIPTYNERAALPIITPEILALRPDIGLLIVDDNSPDGTGQVAASLCEQFPGRMWVLHRQEKSGLGSAYLQGFRWAIQNIERVEYLLQMDADRSHDPAAIPSLIEAAASADLVIGSRYINGVRILDWPMERLLLSHISNTVTRKLIGLPLTDCTSGFKCFRRETIKKILAREINARSYDFQVAVNTLCHWLNLTITEVPITFHNRSQGISKLTRSDVIRAASLIFKLGFMRFLPRSIRVAGHKSY